MGKIGRGRIVDKGASGKYRKIYAYIPADVANDSNFPFKPGDRVWVKIEGKELRIKKWKPG